MVVKVEENFLTMVASFYILKRAVTLPEFVCVCYKSVTSPNLIKPLKRRKTNSRYYVWKYRLRL